MARKMTAADKKALLDDHGGFMNELQGSNDRTWGILFPTYLEEKLAILLRGFLLDTKITEELFTSEQQPLGRFSGKIKLAFALGLLTESEYQDFDIIRKVRNEFAHSLHGRAFNDDDIAGLCSSFQQLRNHKLWPTEPMSRFELACTTLSFKLDDRIKSIQEGDRRIKPWDEDEHMNETMSWVLEIMEIGKEWKGAK